jgi:hypothetical protein
VYFEGQEGQAPRATQSRTESFQCCTVDGDAVRCQDEPVQCFGAWVDQFGACRSPNDGVYPAFCCEVPPPPQACWSDADCSPGLVCDNVNFCESPCTGEEGMDCVAVCYGRCVEDNACARVRCEAGTTCVPCGPDMNCLAECIPTDCRATGCQAGHTCTEMFYDCAAPADGQAEYDCWGGSVWECVPSTEDCRTWGCGEGYACTEMFYDCAAPADGQAEHDCWGGSVWECVPSTEDCRTWGCGEGYACTEMFYDCSTSNDRDVDVDCWGGSAWECVPSTDDCRTWGCGEGFACQEVILNCGGTRPVQDDEEATPTNCGGAPSFQCVPVDCRATGCDQGEVCQGVALPTVCAWDDCALAPEFVCVTDPCLAADCAPDSVCVACEPFMDCAFQCVPRPQDCRATGCGLGFECQEMAWRCQEEVPGQDGGTAPARCGEPTWECVAVDPCAALTEETCEQLSSQRCLPIYVTGCSTCPAGQECPADPCTRSYVGCQSAGW